MTTWRDGTETERLANLIETFWSAKAQEITSSTVNAVTALNSLMTTIASAGGGILILDSTTYTGEGTLQIPASVRLVGSGKTSTIIDISGTATLGNSAVAFTGDDASIEDIGINITGGDYRRGIDYRADRGTARRCKINVTSTAIGGIFTAIYGAFSSAIDGGKAIECEVTGTSTSFNTYGFDGIIANEHTNFEAIKNYVHDVTGTAITRLRWGIYVSGDSQGALVQGNRVHNMGTSGIQVNADAMTASSGYGQRVLGNSVYNCDHIGLAIDGTGVTATGNVVRLCEILLLLGGTTATTGCSITGNTFMETADGSGGSAIDSSLPMCLIDSLANYNTFSGNTIDIRGHALVGLLIDGDNNTISANVFGATSPREAIQTRSSTSPQNNRISGNTIGPSDDTTSNRRIQLFGTNNTASDNHIEVPNGAIGIRAGGTQNHAFHNVLTGAATASIGIWLSGTSNAAIGNITRGSFSTEVDTSTTPATTPIIGTAASTDTNIVL